jgi:hypothetical protein
MKINDLEQLGFVTRIRRVRRVPTPLGFRTVQITNAYRIHEPTRGLGLIAMTLFATESNSWTPSVTNFHLKNATDRLVVPQFEFPGRSRIDRTRA